MNNYNKSYPFCQSLFQYNRVKSCEVAVGNLKIGGDNPIRLQSMTTTNTLDIDATADQCVSVFDVGAELMRITTQGRREAAALEDIKTRIIKKGYDFSLVADVHFNPNAAIEAAQWVEKVRINPGNFTDGAKTFKHIEYTDETYHEQLKVIEEKLIPFLNVCKKHNTAIRIGVNHGSLSDRIMSKYGDTPLGMVESCMEYIHICRKHNFHSIILSIKASNTRVMVHTVRLLVSMMLKEGFVYPIHLGVTEAGSGEDGRVKSAVGIGALLADGIGDTIRVSLTEEPEKEIPVAKILAEHITKLKNHLPIESVDFSQYNPYDYVKRESHKVLFVGGNSVAPVVADLRNRDKIESDILPEAVILHSLKQLLPSEWDILYKFIPFDKIKEKDEKIIPLYKASDKLPTNKDQTIAVEIFYEQLDSKMINYLSSNKNVIIFLKTTHNNSLAEQRAFFFKMQNNKLTHPVIIYKDYDAEDSEYLQVVSSADVGGLFIDGYGDGICIDFSQKKLSFTINTAFGILQASRVRFSKTEFISCPGCGRTLFDLQTTTKEIQAKTAHLKGVKIAIMGCIVNGLGEMADADYGYVGAGIGKISLYKDRELVERNIPQDEAVDKLIDIIKKNGDWIDF